MILEQAETQKLDDLFGMHPTTHTHGEDGYMKKGGGPQEVKDTERFATSPESTQDAQS